MNTGTSHSVSVVMLTYKQTEVLNLIVQGLNQQTYSGDVEIIISDDGSPESVVAQNLAVSRKLRYPLKYVWQPDLGYRASLARNNGIRAAENDLLIFLDGDIVPYPDLIKGHVMQHKIPNRLVAGNRTWIGEIPGIRSLDELRRMPPDRAAVRRGEKEHNVRSEWLRSAHSWRACFSANLSVERKPFVLFDPAFIGWGPDDAEFCYRMCVRHGLAPVYDESIGSYHLESPDSVGNVFRRHDHDSIVNYIRNTFRFFDSCPGLELEDVFYGFPRLQLDDNRGVWSVIPRDKVGDTDLKLIVERARSWMRLNQVES